MASVPLASRLFMRDAGYNEYWLQQFIFDNPGCLGLGDLIPLVKERRQNSGGRLDILFKDAEDDDMFEVEVMLGETDETHIIRTIEYWDNEKRRWPQRKHYAVLVAEIINRRFFNVIHLLSHSIPIIAIQVSLLQVNNQTSISFSTVLNTFEEIDDGTSVEDKPATRADWATNCPWVVETADALLPIAQEEDSGASLSYVQSYIAIGSTKNYVWIKRRGKGMARVCFRVSEVKTSDADDILVSSRLVTKQKSLNNGTTEYRFLINSKSIDELKDSLKRIFSLARSQR